MSGNNQHSSTMFINAEDTGLVIANLRRYNAFTAVFFLGRHHRLLRELAAATGAQPGDEALDIGCGPGKLVRQLGAVVGPTGSTTGIDPSRNAIEHNRATDPAPNHHYQQSTAQQLDLPDAEFDVITCTFVMHHIPEQHRATSIDEMYRVLRPGGRLLLADVHPSPRMRMIFARILRLTGRAAHADPFADVDIRHYTDTLRAVGFPEPRFLVSRYSTGMLVAVKPIES
ncbi:methyltransferase domain-containing protein [Nocardia cyriacigeorgica]|uniref:Methyltransferase domain-containing protein n=1 Tax=Nocardia cyriacigeorgica TaxID=135487 RepID=A0A6P1D216_9NOCA|nr:class I SAM-dependent methyltransferase [Nocardia cyriacigeorgica]NEW43431.1 methyltransferase domain-containing protein [Nocardia cyriacigeorgica]NEW51498.1 methyltransferase domain-containing protein [Nocardia cyriacigeorgica]